jgi:lipoprotein-anchoring transpeptidase ErfK/SrfK
MQRTWVRRFLVGGMAAAAVVAVDRESAAQDGAQALQRTTHARRVIVSLPDRKLALVENGTVVRIYPVAVGKPRTPSPVGQFTIVIRLKNPTYYGAKVVVEPGVSNPLGTRWLGLDQKGYGIHGTSDPNSIGHARSKGCIRMRNADVEDLYERLRTGDVVELIDERTPELARIFGEPAAVPVATLAAATPVAPNGAPAPPPAAR